MTSLMKPALAGAVAIGLICFATPAAAQLDPSSPVMLRLEPVASGLTGSVNGTQQIFPGDVTAIPDGSGRIVVATLGGPIRLIDAAGSLQSTPWLNTFQPGTTSNGATAGGFPFGLTAVEFHPGFADPSSPGYGKFYTVEPEVRRTSPPPDFPAVRPDTTDANNPAHDRVLYEYTLSDINDNTLNLADPGVQRRELFRVHQYRRGHDSGDLAFDNAGNLLASFGDGLEDGFTIRAKDNPFGKLLRINPLAPNLTSAAQGQISSNGNYRVPDDNPYVGDANAIPEIFAEGMRNAFRMSYDPVLDRPFLGVSGASAREFWVSPRAGDNFGWPILEGTNVIGGLQEGPFELPIFEIPHGPNAESANAIIVYRGSDLPGLAGKAIFADLSGRLFLGDLDTVDFDALVATKSQLQGGLDVTPFQGDFVEILIDPTSLAQLPGSIVTLGVDADGEILIAGTNGTIARLAAIPEPSTGLIISVLWPVLARRRRT